MGKPVIRILYLVAVFYALFKHTIFVADSVAVSRIVQSCKRIEEAGSKAAKTTVTKTCIRLFVFDHIKVYIHFLQNFFYRIFDSCIYKVVAKGTSHKELCRQVIKLLYRFFVIFCTGCHPVWHNNFYCTCRNRIKKVVFVCLRNILSILTAQTSRKIFFELFLVKFHLKSLLVSIRHPELVSGSFYNEMLKQVQHDRFINFSLLFTMRFVILLFYIKIGLLAMK